MNRLTSTPPTNDMFWGAPTTKAAEIHQNSTLTPISDALLRCDAPIEKHG